MTAAPAPGRLRPPRMPTLTEVELTGGLHSIVVRRPQVPLVHLRLVFPLPAGEVSRPAGPLVMSQSLLSGTDRHDREGLAAALERLGGRLTASVLDDHIVLSASSLAGRFRDLLGLTGEVLTEATYPAGEVKADRARTSDRILLLLSHPEVLADEALAARLYGRHPYGARVPRPDALMKVGATTVRRLHRSLLQAKSAHLVVVGDVQPKRALAAVEEELGEWLGTSAAGFPPLPPVPYLTPGPIGLVDRPGSVQSNLRLGGPIAERSSPDWPAALVANEIFGGMFTSRLVENLRERNGYTYSPRSTVSHRLAGSTLSISAEVSREATAAALVETRYELGRISTTGVTEEEVETARRHAIGSFLFRIATQGGLASMLATLAVEGVRPGYLSGLPKRVARVKTREVDEAARAYLAPSAMVTVVVGDADAVGRPLSLLDAVTPA